MKLNSRAALICDRGAAAVEFALVSLVLIVFSLGVFEIGRALNQRNQIAQAADFGVRKLLLNPKLSEADLATEVRATFHAGDAKLLNVALGAETVDGAQFRTVTVIYPFAPIVTGLGIGEISLKVSRRAPVF